MTKCVFFCSEMAEDFVFFSRFGAALCASNYSISIVCVWDDVNSRDELPQTWVKVASTHVAFGTISEKRLASRLTPVRRRRWITWAIFTLPLTYIISKLIIGTMRSLKYEEEPQTDTCHYGFRHGRRKRGLNASRYRNQLAPRPTITNKEDDDERKPR